MTTMFIDTNSEMSFVDNERLKFIMHYLKQGADDSLVEMKDGRFVREDSELSFTEIWLPAAEHQQRKIDEQQAKVEELQKRVDKALQEIFKCRVAGLDRIYALNVIEQALKGEGATNLNIDEKGECRHFSTTMFYEGKAECFHCDAVVNEDREVIGKQSKGFSWTGKEHEK